jgi:hypothetical protein
MIPHDGDGAGISHGSGLGDGRGCGTHGGHGGDGFGDGWLGFTGNGNSGGDRTGGDGDGDSQDGLHGDGMSSTRDFSVNCFLTYTEDARGAVINAVMSEQVVPKQ